MSDKVNGLLPCPFCGATPSIYSVGSDRVVLCYEESCPSNYKGALQDAVNAWNTRVINGHQVRFDCEEPGVISSDYCWVVVHGGYMYCGDTWQEVERLVRDEWQHDRHLAG